MASSDKTKSSELHTLRSDHERLTAKCRSFQEEVKALVERNRHLAEELNESQHRADMATADARDAKEELARQETLWAQRETRFNDRLALAERSTTQTTSLEGQLATLRADLRLREQDAERATQALGNLQQVLEQFQDDKQRDDLHHAERMAQLAVQLDEANARAAQEAARGYADAMAATKDARAAASTVPTLHAELDRVRRALQEQLARAASADASELIDRRIVRKMLVTYFQRPQSAKEILELTASLLAFSDDDKVAVGLKQRRGLMAGLFGAGASSGRDGPSPYPGGADSSNFADAWVQFLMEESAEAGTTPPPEHIDPAVAAPAPVAKLVLRTPTSAKPGTGAPAASASAASSATAGSAARSPPLPP